LAYRQSVKRIVVFLRDCKVADVKKRIKGEWSSQEIKRLKGMLPGCSFLDIAGKLNRSVSAVQHKAKELGLRRRVERPWTKKELGYLKEVYRTTPAWKIANKLSRSLIAVRRQAAQMGLGRKTRRGG